MDEVYPPGWFGRLHRWWDKGNLIGVSRRRIVIGGLLFLAVEAHRLIGLIPADKTGDAYAKTLDAAWWLFVVYAFDKGFQAFLQMRGITLPGARDPDQPQAPPEAVPQPR